MKYGSNNIDIIPVYHIIILPINTIVDLVDKDVIVENTTLNQVEFAYTLKVITNDKLNSDTLSTLKDVLNKVK